MYILYFNIYIITSLYLYLMNNIHFLTFIVLYNKNQTNLLLLCKYYCRGGDSTNVLKSNNFRNKKRMTKSFEETNLKT